RHDRLRRRVLGGLPAGTLDRSRPPRRRRARLRDGGPGRPGPGHRSRRLRPRRRRGVRRAGADGRARAADLRAGRVPPMGALPFDEWQVELHGHRVIYRIAGSGPPVVLIHGMINSSRHWEAVALRLATSHTVIAPDLIGHGDSATPRGDYSIGAHAAVIRDVLAAIGIDRASVVGHSLGGGLAMQVFYQFPQRVERLVLVSSGALGHEVSPLLRVAALPGASALLALVAHARVLDALDAGGERLRVAGRGKGVYLQALAPALRPLQHPPPRG